MIKEGKAYMDDTDQETMQAERFERKESKCRNVAPDVNLAIFERLLKGEPEAQKFCMRAKIDMQSVNGTMRDPVMYRYNDTPHHRTGTKHKAYPTYDFVCPILDAIEGVTHALRTTEYNDREEQYYWIQQALHLRAVKITTFGKMNFVNTVLSKRKLNWFVEQKLVEGWFDPRFPTIQGCVRRGVNVEALKNFIISQGASRRVITMEWDKFWSENKKLLEEKCPRYMGVHKDGAVILTIENVEDKVTAHSVQVHPQKAEYGMRVMRRYNQVYIDQVDAVTYKEGEEITLLRWGNVKISAIEKDGAGNVLSLKGTYDAASTNFSKTKKATWLAAIEDVVPCKFVEFDHLIWKAKLGDEEDFKDFVNPVTRAESDGLVDPCFRTVQEGDVIQLERKGFFRCDKPFKGEGHPIVLFAIPDGKAKSLNATPAAASAGGKKK
jgi:glutamyl-tRNA synthetase